jgi:hypothetical protein
MDERHRDRRKARVGIGRDRDLVVVAQHPATIEAKDSPDTLDTSRPALGSPDRAQAGSAD